LSSDSRIKPRRAARLLGNRARLLWRRHSRRTVSRTTPAVLGWLRGFVGCVAKSLAHGCHSRWRYAPFVSRSEIVEIVLRRRPQCPFNICLSLESAAQNDRAPQNFVPFSSHDPVRCSLRFSCPLACLPIFGA